MVARILKDVAGTIAERWRSEAPENRIVAEDSPEASRQRRKSSYQKRHDRISEQGGLPNATIVLHASRTY